MATRKIEVNEDDLKKVILILKLSKQYLQIPNDNLVLYNMWRVSGKLADKLMRKAELVMVTNKGRTTLKPIGEVTSEVADKNLLRWLTRIILLRKNPLKNRVIAMLDKLKEPTAV